MRSCLDTLSLPYQKKQGRLLDFIPPVLDSGAIVVLNFSSNSYVIAGRAFQNPHLAVSHSSDFLNGQNGALSSPNALRCDFLPGVYDVVISDAYGGEVRQSVVVSGSQGYLLTTRPESNYIQIVFAFPAGQKTLEELEGFIMPLNVKSNWAETDTNSASFIQNKPNFITSDDLNTLLGTQIQETIGSEVAENLTPVIALAQAAATAAETAVDSLGDVRTQHVLGATYSTGTVVFSNVNDLSYRALTDHTEVTSDPSNDDVNWERDQIDGDEQRVTNETNPIFDLSKHRFFDLGELSGNVTLDWLNIPTTKGAKISVKVDQSFNLTDGYDVANAVFKNVQTDMSSVHFVAFSQQGHKMYVTFRSSSNQYVKEYDLLTPWEISTKVYVGEINFYTSEGNNTDFYNPSQMCISEDGTKVLMAFYSDEVCEFTLSTPFDITSATFVQRFEPSQTNGKGGVFVKPDGTKMYLVEYSGNMVQEYDLPTPWSLTGATYVAESVDLHTYADNAHSISFNEDGTLFIVHGPASSYGTRMTWHALTTAWDITTAASLTGSRVFSEIATTNNYCAVFGKRGRYLYTAGPNEVNQYTMGVLTEHSINWGNDVVTKDTGAERTPYAGSTSVYELEVNNGELRMLGATHNLEG